MALLLCASNIYAQREKNNIYLFDCTWSMKTAGLWEPAKSALDATINNQKSIPGSEFTVIPFGDDAYEYIIFNDEQYNQKKDIIDKAFDKYVAKAKYTHISNVLKAGFGKTNVNKENRIYLLTDGMPNGGDSPEAVAATINAWCAAHRNCRFFYVALTNGIINPVIRRAIDNCPDAFIIETENGIIPQIADISSDVYTNIEELDKPRQIDFSMPGEYELSVVSSDSLFDVKIKDNKASGGKITLLFAPKADNSLDYLHQTLQGSEHDFTLEIKSSDPKYFIANPKLKVHVSDEVKSELLLADNQDELMADGAKWHDSFWWSDASPDTRVQWDLQPVFTHALPQSGVTFLFAPGEGQGKDYTVWYNGKQLDNDAAFKVCQGEPALIQVQFEHNAATGKRYFKLEPQAANAVDMVNGAPYSDYEGTSLRTSYSVNWNPLYTAVFWIGLILTGLLILWLLILKQLFYPAIKVNKIIVAGPGSYYVSKKIKGARKVIFTSRKQSQGLLSRIFTGEVRYVRDEHFSPDIAIEPSGSKKRVKVRSLGKGDNNWDILPAGIFTTYDKGSLTNSTTGDKAEIEFS